MKRLHNILLLAIGFGLCCLSCTKPLKPYERVYVNDSEMEHTCGTAMQFQKYVHSIREGSISPQGKKGKGGCGCN